MGRIIIPLLQHSGRSIAISCAMLGIDLRRARRHFRRRCLLLLLERPAVRDLPRLLRCGPASRPQQPTRPPRSLAHPRPPARSPPASRRGQPARTPTCSLACLPARPPSHRPPARRGPPGPAPLANNNYYYYYSYCCYIIMVIMQQCRLSLQPPLEMCVVVVSSLSKQVMSLVTTSTTARHGAATSLSSLELAERRRGSILSMRFLL